MFSARLIQNEIHNCICMYKGGAPKAALYCIVILGWGYLTSTCLKVHDVTTLDTISSDRQAVPFFCILIF